MKSPARWLTLAAVAWAFVLTAGLVFAVVAVHNPNDGTVSAGQTMFDTDGFKALSIVLAPFVWITVTAAIAWTASRRRSFALSVLAGVLGIILATLCGLTILAVFTPIPFVGLAFGVSAVLLLIAIFTERADIKAERTRQLAGVQPAASPATSSPGTPTAP